MAEMAVARDAGYAYRLFARAWEEGVRPRPMLPVSEWADAYRYLPQKAASEHGRWRTDRMPHLREILDRLSPADPCEFVDVMKCTQGGGTEIILNMIGSVIDQVPGPFMAVQPTGKALKRFSKQRVQAMIDATPALAGKVMRARSRDSANTMDMKEFAGGTLYLALANSAADLSSMPVRYVAMDEVDKYPDKVGDESAPEDEAEARTTTYRGRRKVAAVSSPSLSRSSKIEKRFRRGDQREYFVPCPHCGHMDYFRDGNLTDAGLFVCHSVRKGPDGEDVEEGCGELIGEEHKAWMLERGEWRPLNPEGEPKRHSYHFPAAVIPHGLGPTWAEIAAERAACGGDPNKEQNYTNKRWGMPYENRAGRIELGELERLRVPGFERRTIPPGCLLLTSAVDLQANRFAVIISGWGRGERWWPIDMVEIPGTPTRREDWEEMWRHVRAPIENSYGVAMVPRITAIDSGNWTNEAYAFVRAHLHEGAIAIKGASVRGKPVIGTAKKADTTMTGRTKRGGLIVWDVGTDTAKQTLLGRIRADVELAGQEADSLEGRMVLIPHDAPKHLLEQLTSEQFDQITRKFVRVQGLRNEMLDVAVYSYAAAHHPFVRMHLLREADWAALEREVEPRVNDLFAEGGEPVAKEKQVPRPTGLGDKDWNL